MTFKIDSEKLDEVVRIFRNEVDVKANASELHDAIAADWNEGDEHQDWINEANAQEVVDWLAAFWS